MRIYLILWLWTALVVRCWADTEIVNLHLQGIALASTELDDNSIFLHPSQPMIINLILPENRTYTLNVTSGKSYTIRASWPGSSPTKVKLDAYVSTRGIAILDMTCSALSPTFPGVQGAQTTRLELLLEPLIWGVIPQSLLPTIFWLAVFGSGAAAVVPYLIRLLEAQVRPQKSKVS